MLDALVAAVAGWPVSVALRQSVWIYPLVNTGHILGIAALFGSVLCIDLRLLGLWSNVPLAPVLRMLFSVAKAGLTLAVLMGVLLLIARAGDYVWHQLFQAKMALLVLAMINALWFTRSAFWKGIDSAETMPASIRLSALVSLVLWLSVILLGRLIGYR